MCLWSPSKQNALQSAAMHVIRYSAVSSSSQTNNDFNRWYPVQAEGVTVWSCRLTQSRCSCGCRRSFPLVGSPTSDGDVPLVDHEKPGAPRSGLTSECLLVTTGTPVSTWATVEWSNGPQGLRDDDDDVDDDDDNDDDDSYIAINILSYKAETWYSLLWSVFCNFLFVI